jgi:hypothetical protein
MGRADVPADAQWTRVLIAVALGLLFACSMLRPIEDSPSVRTLLPELRAVAGISCLVI